MYLPDCSKRQRVEPPHVKEGIGMSEDIDAVLKSANWSKESIIEYLIPLFQDHVGVDKGQDHPTADHCRQP